MPPIKSDRKNDASTGRRIVPVLLSGGAGTRLWPLSRETYPKQLLSLVGESTLLQQTASRVADRAIFSAPLVVAHEDHRFVIAEQLRALGITDSQIVLEPARRNTAPAVATAALVAAEADPDATLLVMPVDHLVRDVEAFNDTVMAAAAAASAGRLVLFGINPTEPATGYGYIKIGTSLADDINEVAGFVEKPSLEVAEQFLSSRDYLWNSGIFLLPVGLFLRELERLAPDILKACRAALAGARRDLDFLRLAEKPFAASLSISLDYAVMEKTARAAVVSATSTGTTSAASRHYGRSGIKTRAAMSRSVTSSRRMSAVATSEAMVRLWRLWEWTI